MEGVTPCPKTSRNPISVPFLLKNDPLASEPNALWTFNLEDELGISLLRRQLSEEEELRIGHILQRRLFFDVISALLGVRIQPIDFTKNDCVDMYSDVPVYHFRKWGDNIMKHSLSAKKAAHGRMLKVLDFVLACIDDTEKRLEDYHRDGGLVVVIMLSVRLLLDTLEDYQTAVFLVEEPISEWRFAADRTTTRAQLHWTLLIRLWFTTFLHARAQLPRGFYDKFRTKIEKSRKSRMLHHHVPIHAGEVALRPSAVLLRSRLIDSGWCPIKAQYQCQTLTYAEINFLSLLNTSRPPGIKHDLCTHASGCTVYTIKPDVYQPQHAGDCLADRCSPFHVELESLAKILENGDYPVVSVDIDCTPWKVDIVSYTPAIPYVFFSHVWSDGLGNVHENAIPRCQLVRLVRLILNTLPTRSTMWSRATVWYYYRGLKPDYHSRDGKLYFWLDTLCIPCAGVTAVSQSIQRLREKAIRKITPVIVNAAATVVLDTEIEDIPSEDVPELPAHILSSKWIQRIWTLEEGCLAKSCFFANGGLSCNPTAVVRGVRGAYVDGQGWLEDCSFRESAINRLWFLVYRILQQSKRDLIYRNYPVLSHQDEFKNFVDVWNELRIRSASYPDDAVLVFAHLLDFRSAILSQHDKQERLPKLIKSCGQIPLSLLYNRGPRVGREYSHYDAWLPTKLSGDQLMPGALLRLSKDGLGSTKLLVDRSSLEPGTLRVYTLVEMLQGDVDQAVFILRDRRHDRQYIIQHDCPIPDGPQAGSTTTRGQDSCYVLDFSYERSPTRGYAARGFSANVVARDAHSLILVYACPISAWSNRQWKWPSQGRASISLVTIDAQCQRDDLQIVLRHGQSLGLPMGRGYSGFS